MKRNILKCTVLKSMVKFLVLGILFSGCKESRKSFSDFKTPQQLESSMSKVTPRQLKKFNKTDSLYFQYLGVKTFPAGKGNFILSDWQGQFIAELDSTGFLIKKVTKKGRGPGELQDVISMTRRPNGGIIVYDQINRKIVIYDANYNFESEFPAKSFNNTISLDYYDLNNEGQYIAALGSNRWMRNNEEPRKLILAHFDGKTKTYSQPHYYLNRPYARLLINGQASGGSAVPFAADQIIRYNPKSQHFWILWTPSGEIAEVNSKFDTLRTVTVKLPSQGISASEIDSLKEQYRKRQWETVRKKLPDQKVPIQDMHIDSKGRFWLKLSYRSHYNQWLVSDSTGKPQKIVQLPDSCYLTHISKYNLGVRLNSNTFALYAPVQ